MSDALLEPTPSASEPMAGEIPFEGPGEEPETDLAAIGGLFTPGRRALSAGLVMTVTLVAFEALAVATVMPTVKNELGDVVLYGWVFAAFFLASLVGIVVAGQLIDRGELIRPMTVGLGLFSVGLVVGGLAPSMAVLVGGRVLQGLGAGAIPPIAYVAIRRALPDQLRPRMFATLSTAWVLPGVIGPAVAGAIAVATSWRVVFLGLLPLIVVAGAITLPALRTVPPPDDGPEDGRVEPAADSGRRLRTVLVMVVGAGLIVAGLTSGSLPGLVVAGIGAALVVPTFRRLTPEGTLRARPGLPAAVLLRGFLTFGFFCADAYVTLALHDWRGVTLAVAGLALTGATLSWTAGAWVQARWVATVGPMRLIRAGFLVVIAGIAAFVLVLWPSVPVAAGIAAWTLAGFGMGLAYAPISLIVLREAQPGAEGTATSGLQLSDVLGTALGTGVGGAIIAMAHDAGLEPWVGLLGAFAAGAAVSVIGTALTPRLSTRAADGVPAGAEPRKS